MGRNIRRKGGKRGAHPSYGVMMTSKPKHKSNVLSQAAKGKWRGKKFAKPPPDPVGIGKRARWY